MMPYALDIPGGWQLPEDINDKFLRGEFDDPDPQIPLDPDDPRYLNGYITPFHYRHPVTGKVTSEKKLNATLVNKQKKTQKKNKSLRT
jgi:hypothetical protein